MNNLNHLRFLISIKSDSVTPILRNAFSRLICISVKPNTDSNLEVDLSRRFFFAVEPLRGLNWLSFSAMETINDIYLTLVCVDSFSTTCMYALNFK